MKTALVLFALVAVASAGVDFQLPGSVQCDSTTACPDGTTCCATASGSWGCCPGVKSTCCDDHVHCCPSQYPVCDVAHGQCKASSGLTSVPLLKKGEAMVKEELPATVQCDSKTACPDGTTCCATASGSWGCCPSTGATCCDDHVHCCPSQYPVCDVAHGQCKASSGSGVRAFAVPFVTKVAAIDTPVLPGYAEVQAEISKTVAVAIAEGILEGFAFQEVPDLETCVSEAEPILMDVDAAIKLLLQKTPKAVAEALMKFADAVKKIAPAAQSCQASEAEVAKLVKSLEAFTSPKDFIYHVGKDLIVNHVQIFGDVNTAVVDYKAGQFRNFGVDIGRVLALLVQA